MYYATTTTWMAMAAHPRQINLIVVYCSNINKHTNPPRAEMLKTILLVVYCSNINEHANPPRVEMLKSIFLVVWTGLNWLLPVFYQSWTGCLEDWLQLVATTMVDWHGLVLCGFGPVAQNLANKKTSSVRLPPKFDEKTGPDRTFKL